MTADIPWWEDRHPAGPPAFGALVYVEPDGQWWVAPIGTAQPDLDRPLPPVWVPVQRITRDEAR